MTAEAEVLSLVPAQPQRALTSYAPSSIGQAVKIAQLLADSNLLPEHFRGKEADIFWAMAKGADLGLSPAASLDSFYTYKGKIGMYATAMVGVVLGSGKAEYFDCVESNAERAVFATKRKGASTETRKAVTIEDAKEAGWFNNDKYKREPARMLEARAKSWLARLVYPDVLLGITSFEELILDDTPSYSAPPPAPRPLAPEPEPTSEELDEAIGELPEAAVEQEVETVSEVDILRSELEAGNISDDIVKRLKALPKGTERDALRALYKKARANSAASRPMDAIDREVEQLTTLIEAGDLSEAIKKRIRKLPDAERAAVSQLFDEVKARS